MAESETPEDNVVHVDFAERIARGEIDEMETPDGSEMAEWVFTNDRTNMATRQLFHMLYQSVFTNKLGVMHAKKTDSELIETLIVGIELTPDGVATWPIAKLLTEEEQGMYKAPDGNGGWVE